MSRRVVAVVALLALAGCAGAPPAGRVARPPEAREPLGEAVRPRATAPARLAEARQALARGDYGAAAEAARSARGLDPTLAGARRLEARARQGMGDLSGSLSVWEDVLADRPDDPEAVWAVAVLSDRLGWAGAALAALSGPPVTPARAGTAGWLALRLGRYARARDLLEQTLGTGEEERFLALLGRARLLAGDRDGAADAARRAVAAAPDDPAAWTLAGDADRSRGLASAAADAYRNALALDPVHVPALLGLGDLLLSQGRAAEAAGRFEAATRAWPDAPEPWNDLGVALRAQGRLEPARRAYERALEADSGFEPALKNLGVLHEKYLGRPGDAVTLYDRYLERRPGDEEVRRWRKAAQRRAEAGP